MSDMSDYYKKGHSSYDMSQVAFTDSRITNIVETVKRVTPENGKVLDVGCGDGFLRTLLPGFNYTGLDIDATRYSDAIKHDLAVTPYPFEDGSFDTVICTEVLEHLWEPEKTIKEIARILRHHGKAVITVPNYNNIDNILDNYRGLIYDKRNLFTVEHIRQYTITSLGAMFEAAGFEVQGALGNSPHMQEFFVGPRKALGLLLGDLSKVDIVLGQMFPQYCMGFMLLVSKVMR